MKFKIGNSENRSLRIEFDWKNHKFGTILEVLRIGFVVTSLFFFVLAAFGCKDKAEAKDPNDYDVFIDCTFGEIDPNDVIDANSYEESGNYEPEPNEPKSMRYSLPIPTWPDYIELERDLVIQSPWYGEYWKPIITYTLEKGTKIYFKEDE